MERWLSLTVSPASAGKKARSGYFISIPKKIVRLAVRRNRIRRVLREALRAHGGLEAGKIHLFKVTCAPEDVGLAMAKKALHELLH